MDDGRAVGRPAVIDPPPETGARQDHYASTAPTLRRRACACRHAPPWRSRARRGRRSDLPKAGSCGLRGAATCRARFRTANAQTENGAARRPDSGDGRLEGTDAGAQDPVSVEARGVPGGRKLRATLLRQAHPAVRPRRPKGSRALAAGAAWKRRQRRFIMQNRGRRPWHRSSSRPAR